MHKWYRGEYFYEKEMWSYVCTLWKKWSFWKNVNFGLVALAFHYGNCLNATLSRYTLKIYFVFKKLILKNNRSKPVLITPWQVSCSPAHVSIKS